MWTKAWFQIGCIALLTMAFVLAVCWPKPVVAGGPEKTPLNMEPILKVKGCEVAAKTTQTAFKADDEPVLEVKAANQTKETVELKLTLQMFSAREPANENSRVMPMPKQLWMQECALTLAPAANRTLTVPTKVKVQSPSVYFVIREGKTSIALPQIMIVAKAK